MLLGISHRKTGRVPASLYVRHVLALTCDTDWPVQRAAIEALLRRCSVAKQDGLEVSSRPPRGSVLGTYTTRRAGSVKRPYTTLLDSVEPLRGSCDCRDFVRNSLGVCKHLCAILDDLAADKSRFEMAVAGHGTPAPVARVTWDPIRPLTGDGDWLARLRLVDGKVNGSQSDALARASRWFRRADGGDMVLRSAWTMQPERRLELVGDLWCLVAPEAGRRNGGLRLAEPAVRERQEGGSV